MAKIPYSKFKIKIKEEIKNVKFNDVDIEIKQYLPIEEKLQIISNVTSISYEQDINYFNPVKISIFTNLEIIFSYTNINFTDKQKENLTKLYDEIKSSGLLNLIIANIPEEEVISINTGVKDTVTSLYNFQTSALGILKGLTQNQELSMEDLNVLKQSLNNIQNSDLYKNLVSILNIEDNIISPV